MRTQLCLLIGFILALTSKAEARLGWTLEQSKKEYGEPKKIEGNKVSFLTPGGRTVNILLDPKGIVQALEITPVTRDEALNFKDEHGIGWVSTSLIDEYGGRSDLFIERKSKERLEYPYHTQHA